MNVVKYISSYRLAPLIGDLVYTEEEASEAYNTHKYKIIAEVAAEQEEPLRSALLRLKVI